MKPLHYLSASDAAEQLRAREISSVELTRHMLERIDALDPNLRAYATVTAELALDQADKADRELAARIRLRKHRAARRDVSVRCASQAVTGCSGLRGGARRAQ